MKHNFLQSTRNTSGYNNLNKLFFLCWTCKMSSVNSPRRSSRPRFSIDENMADFRRKCKYFLLFPFSIFFLLLINLNWLWNVYNFRGFTSVNVFVWTVSILMDLYQFYFSSWQNALSHKYAIMAIFKFLSNLASIRFNFIQFHRRRSQLEPIILSIFVPEVSF